MNTRPYSDELTHYGVKGMKWGVRKARYHKRRAETNEAKRRAAGVYARTNTRVAELYPHLGAVNKLSAKFYSRAEQRYQKLAEEHVTQFLQNKWDVIATASNVDSGKRYIEQALSLQIDPDRIDKKILGYGVAPIR